MMTQDNWLSEYGWSTDSRAHMIYSLECLFTRHGWEHLSTIYVNAGGQEIRGWDTNEYIYRAWRYVRDSQTVLFLFNQYDGTFQRFMIV